MKYAIKKTATMIITLFFVSVLVFFSFSLIPGNPAVSRLGTEATPEKVAALTHEMGLDRPVMVRFGEWFINVLRGDFGQSYSYRQSVTSLLSDKIKITLLLSVMAIVICAAVSIPLGIFMARKSDSKLDIFFSSVNQVIMAIPSFF